MLSRRRVLKGAAAAMALPMVNLVRADAALVPAYFPPDVYADAWAQLTDPRLFAVVLNVMNGPGTAPVPMFVDAVRAIEDRGGTVAGYIDMDYGRRDPAAVRAEAQRYRNWYHVGDVFCDRVPSEPGHLPFMQQVTDRLRKAGSEFIVFNHGVYPDPQYATIADLLVTFEGPLSAYQAAQPPEWTLTFDRQKFCHIVYDVPDAEFDDTVQLAHRRNTGIVYLTDRAGANPYDVLPSYFPRLLTL